MLLLNIKATTMQNDKFIVRAYGFGELAQLYFPAITKKSASAQLRKWIKLNKKLEADLLIFGYNQSLRLLTPKHINLIIVYLGEP